MKFKEGWDKVYEEEVSPEMHARMVRKVQASAQQESQAGAEPWYAWLLRPVVVGPALGFAALAVVLLRTQSPSPAPGVPVAQSVRYEAEMVQNAELLYDLQVLRNMAAMEKAGKAKWPKKRS